MNFSIIEYYGKQTRSNCGYCKQKYSSHSHGMHAYVMKPEDYQDLINRGWRRAGEYCYKQTNNLTCCPSYTIRCDSTEFKLSKSHKKVLRRVNKFLKDGIKDKEINKTSELIPNDRDNCEMEEEPEITNRQKMNISIKDISGDNVLPEITKMSSVTDTPVESVSEIPSKDKPKVLCKKAKQIRIERKKEKLIAKGISLENLKKCEKQNNQEKCLSDFIDNASETDSHKLELRQIEVNSEEFKNTSDEAYKLYTKYQTVIHNDPPNNKAGFLNFLQRSPIKLCKIENGPRDGFGSFHQQYWLDGKLIAVGVIDILPNCISSVYFFYDPEYSFLSLGTYSSLREINFTRQLSKTVPSLKYYYMGFYIHSCPKMRYKGRLCSSYLLCPEKYTWHLITDEMKAKLENQKYQVFNSSSVSVNELTSQDLDSVLILSQPNSFTSYKNLKNAKNINIDSVLLEYGNLVGKPCLQRMLYVNF